MFCPSHRGLRFHFLLWNFATNRAPNSTQRSPFSLSLSQFALVVHLFSDGIPRCHVRALGSFYFPQELKYSRNGKEDPPAKDLQDFYLASGFQSPVPDEVTELMEKRSLQEGIILIKIVLWILIFRVGTLVLCGSSSFSRGFPFTNRFSDITVEKREHVLKKWSRERVYTPLRLVFLVGSYFSSTYSTLWFGCHTYKRISCRNY